MLSARAAYTCACLFRANLNTVSMPPLLAPALVLGAARRRVLVLQLAHADLAWMAWRRRPGASLVQLERAGLDQERHRRVDSVVLRRLAMEGRVMRVVQLVLRKQIVLMAVLPHVPV